MGKVKTPLSLRWNRAQAIASNGDVRVTTRVNGIWHARIQGTADEPYKVQAALDDEAKLTACGCSCPDFLKEMQGLGEPLLRGIRVCKHTLALATVVYERLETEFYS